MPDAPSRPERFTPQATQAALDDLRARLRATRWPDAPEDAGWSLGLPWALLWSLLQSGDLDEQRDPDNRAPGHQAPG